MEIINLSVEKLEVAKPILKNLDLAVNELKKIGFDLEVKITEGTVLS